MRMFGVMLLGLVSIIFSPFIIIGITLYAAGKVMLTLLFGEGKYES